jgi:hypothetical protein
MLTSRSDHVVNEGISRRMSREPSFPQSMWANPFSETLFTTTRGCGKFYSLYFSLCVSSSSYFPTLAEKGNSVNAG